VWQSVAVGLEIVHDGEARAVIVVPDEAVPVEKAAAEELRYHIRASSGAELSVLTESEHDGEGAAVYLGATVAAGKAGLDLEGLPPNGFIIRRIEERLFMLGDDTDGEPFWIQHNNRERVGTLFAVYEFLDDHLGVRWLWPGELGEVIPTRKTVSVDAWDKRAAPFLGLTGPAPSDWGGAIVGIRIKEVAK
jgi:hypothetical protein